MIEECQHGARAAEGRGDPCQDDLLQFLLAGGGDQGGGEVGDLVGTLPLGSRRGHRFLSARLELGVVADHLTPKTCSGPP